VHESFVITEPNRRSLASWAITADLAVVREAAETNLYGPWLIPDSLVSGARRRDLA
jgi:hypothetical protein